MADPPCTTRPSWSAAQSLSWLQDLKGRSAGGDAHSDHFVVEGEIAVHRLLHSGIAVEVVVGTKASAARLRPHLGTTAFVELGAAELRALVGFAFHRGCLAVAKRPRSDTAAHRAPLPREAGIVAVAVEAVSDPSNVGALARNCRAFGVGRMAVDRASGDPYSRRAIRAAMGHVLSLQVDRLHDLVAWLDWHRQELPGLQVIAATLDPAALSIDRVMGTLRTPAVLVVGNEGFGLSESLRRAAHRQVRIPMASDVDSINVAAASAILLHALGRWRS